MIIPAAAFCALLLMAGPRQADIRYFSNVRDVSVSGSNQQNYVIVDEAIWQHSRRDLADIRLYDDNTQVPYILLEQSRKTAPVDQTATILNLGAVGDHTEFDLEIQNTRPYDRIRLQMDAKDFIANAALFGQSSLSHSPRTQLGSSTLYDFSREKLASNFILQLPTSTFPYVHVRLTPGIRPEQVKAASVFELQDQPARWRNVGVCKPPAQEGKRTTAVCNIPAGVPLERIQFLIPAEQVNFRRNVSVSVGRNEIANADISRVRMTRGSAQVISEQLSIDVPDRFDEQDIHIAITNGDDAPLPLESVQGLALERRLYFNPAGRSLLKMYYGDPALESPIYDYAKFFHEEANAVPATLGLELHNAEFTPRPDDRPWSERHKLVLWAAMLLAVLILTMLAIRGFTTKPGLSE